HHALAVQVAVLVDESLGQRELELGLERHRGGAPSLAETPPWRAARPPGQRMYRPLHSRSAAPFGAAAATRTCTPRRRSRGARWRGPSSSSSAPGRAISPEAVEEIEPLRLVALVVVEDDGDALAVGLPVDHFLAPAVELLGRGEVALDGDPARLQHARAAVRPGVLAVVVLHHLGLELDPVHLVDAADGDAVDLQPEPVAQVEVAVGLG